MKIIADQSQPELVNLQPGGAIPIMPGECADDAPC